jgi:DNA (cytosine-5)-methyltransferase 1
MVSQSIILQDVYEREIPSESLDIYMTSPPCQAFSLAGKRLGKDDKRGILFFNSLEFIQVNKPRYFIFENVKGLLSDDGGKTFSEWVNLLGGKSVNGLPVLFPYEDSVPYHLYWKVLNAKNHGVPQNRERVFLIGIRDDSDNTFRFPAEEHLTKRLKDVLEDDVDDKYFLSETAINEISEITSKWRIVLDKDIPDKSRCIVAGYYNNLLDGQYLKIKSATSKGYEEATEGDSINFSVPNSETRRGRVGKGVAQTLDTGCNQGVIQ